MTLSSKSRDQWLSAFEGKDVAVAPVHDVNDSFQDPQIDHRAPDDEGITRVGVPLAHAGSPLDASEDVPLQGEHTGTVLRDHDFTDEEIEEFRADDVI